MVSSYDPNYPPFLWVCQVYISVKRPGGGLNRALRTVVPAKAGIQSPQEVDQSLESDGNRLEAHRDPIAAEAKPARLDGTAASTPGEPHQPDGLPARAARGARDSGDGDARVRVAALERARGHLARHLLAHRAVLAKGVLRDAQHLLLGDVGVSHEPALEPLGAPRDARDRRGHASAGARLRGRHIDAAPLARPAQHAREPRHIVFGHWVSPGRPRYQYM